MSDEGRVKFHDEARVKFLPNEQSSEGSVNESVNQISAGKKQTKFIESESDMLKINDEKKQIRKTVQMKETAVEISDSDEYSDTDDTEEEDQQNANGNKKWKAVVKVNAMTKAMMRRPSLNPALFNLSSSSEEESSSNESGSDENGYFQQRYNEPSSSSDENDVDHQYSKEFTRVLRKTLVTNRKTLRTMQTDTNSSESLGVSPMARPTGLQRFQAAARTVNITQHLYNSMQDHEGTSIEAKKAAETNTTTIQQVPSDVGPRKVNKRREAISDKNQGDFDIREHLERLAKNPDDLERWTINPYSKFRFRWDIATVFIILCNVITLPLEFSIYDGRKELDGLKMFTDIWFMIDIMLNFRTGFSTGEGRGNVNMNPAAIRKAYLRSWFAIDMLATIPFDIILTGFIDEMKSSVELEDISMYLKITRVLKILKLLRLLRLGRFVRYLHRWEEILSMDYGTGENVMTGLQWLLIMLFICHWNACILFLIPTNVQMDPLLNETSYGPKDSYTTSWFYAANIEKLAPYEQYFWCLFKSLSHMLTIGYGVNTPTLMTDLWTSVFVMFTGALTFALFLSQIISLVDQMKITATRFKRHVREVDDYLRFNRCSRNLKEAVKEYYDFHYRQRVFDEATIFEELNPLLLEEVTTCGIIEFIQECDLFESCRSDLQIKLCRLFKVEMYQPFTNIVLSSRSARTFSIIRQGVVSVETDKARRGHFYHLEEGESFGLEAFANVTNPRYVTTVLAETWVEVLQLNVSQLHELVQKNPEYRDSLNLIDTLANQQLKQSGLYQQITNRQREVRKHFG